MAIIADIQDKPLNYAQISGLVMLLKITVKQTYSAYLKQVNSSLFQQDEPKQN